jgi:hypothetical protein
MRPFTIASSPAHHNLQGSRTPVALPGHAEMSAASSCHGVLSLSFWHAILSPGALLVHTHAPSGECCCWRCDQGRRETGILRATAVCPAYRRALYRPRHAGRIHRKEIPDAPVS